jgi:hypothetical protein
MDTKSIFLSKTFWGLVVSGAAAFLPKLGVHISPAGYEEITQTIVEAIGFGLAAYGRFKATKALSVTGK